MNEEEIVVLTKSIQENADRLGLIWKLTPGAVVTTDPLTVLTDSPDENTLASIPVMSLVGDLVVGTRVMVMSVPPAGQYVIGQLTNIPRGIINANTTNNGAVATATSTTPVPVPSASWDVEPEYVFRDGWVYKVTFQGGTATAGGTAMFGTVQVRLGSATAVGTLLCNWPDAIPAGFNNIVITKNFESYIQNSSGADVTSELSVCAVRNTAASNYIIYGDSVQPLWLTVEEIGLASELPGLATHAVSV